MVSGSYNAGATWNPVIAEAVKAHGWDQSIKYQPDQQLDVDLYHNGYRFLFELKDLDLYSSVIANTEQCLEEELNGTSEQHPGYVRTPADFKAVIYVEPELPMGIWDIDTAKKVKRYLLSTRVLHSLMAKYRDFSVLQFTSKAKAVEGIFDFIQQPITPLDLKLPPYKNLKHFPSGLSKMLYLGVQGTGKEHAVQLADAMDNTLANIFGDAPISPKFMEALTTIFPPLLDGTPNAMVAKTLNFLNCGKEMKAQKLGIVKKADELNMESQ